MKEITCSVKKTLVMGQSRKHLGCVSDLNLSLTALEASLI